jgi:hypothetical protein
LKKGKFKPADAGQLNFYLSETPMEMKEILPDTKELGKLLE